MIAGLVVLVVGSLGGWLYYSLRHMSIPITAAQATDIQLAFKGSLGEAIFGTVNPQNGSSSKGTGLDAVLTPSTATKSDGLIAEYQREPEKFRRYAQLFDTAITARHIGEALQANRANHKFPLLSSAVAMNANDSLDAWGHPYCVSALKDGLAVVSGGPDAKSFACDEQKIQSKELSSATRLIFQSSQGEVVVLVKQTGGRGTN
jgi:hypothetical protein